MSDTPTLEIVRIQLRVLGLTVERCCPRGYRVNFNDNEEITAYYADDLGDALETGLAMHAATIEFRTN